MPLVHIHSNSRLSEEIRVSISEAVHSAMVETIGIPADDKFQIFCDDRPGHVIYDPGYLGIERSNGVVIIQITLNMGRTVEKKKALYRRIVDLMLLNAGVRKEDVVINLIEVPKENWSFGHGEAPYAG